MIRFIITTTPLLVPIPWVNYFSHSWDFTLQEATWGEKALFCLILQRDTFHHGGDDITPRHYNLLQVIQSGSREVNGAAQHTFSCISVQGTTNSCCYIHSWWIPFLQLNFSGNTLIHKSKDVSWWWFFTQSGWQWRLTINMYIIHNK